MIAENMEQAEKTDPEAVIQALQSYLRQETSYEAMQQAQVAEGMEKRLALKAKDFCLQHGDNSLTDDNYTALAREAIRRYMHNWHDKKQGEDDRGHRLGKSSFTPF